MGVCISVFATMSASLENTYASIPATTRGKPFFLGGDPKGENFLYTCGNSVIIRNIANPKISDTYDEHQYAPTVAKYSPSGYYICSGDSVGGVRIWDTTQKEHPLKAEYRMLGASIYDLDWSEDSKRIVVCGDGRENYAKAFFMDSGASVGELSGHIKPVNSISMKPNRPYRVASCGEDFQVNWYEGPPFKFKKKMTDHTRFANCVRFAPNGSLLVSAGSDKQLVFYDGKTGEQTKTIPNAHGGGIYCCSWSPDSTKLLTASADRSCKIWDVASGECVTTFQFEKTVENQQLGCLWQGDYLLSVNLAGHITYLNQANPSEPIRVLKGHNKFVTALQIDKKNGNFYSGSYDANITRWNVETGDNEILSGKGHSNQITQLSVDGDNIYSSSMDDSVRVTPTGGLEYSGSSIGTDSPVVGIDSKNGVAVAASMKSIYVLQNGSLKHTVSVNFTPTAVAVSNDGSQAAVGGDDNKIHLFSNLAGGPSESKVLEGHRGGVISIQYSPDGSKIASGGKDRNVMVWSASGDLLIDGWIFHNAQVGCVAWSPDSKRIASASQDQNLIVWNTEDKGKRIVIKGAHRGGCNCVSWWDDNTIFSAGQDCTIKSWKLS